MSRPTPGPGQPPTQWIPVFLPVDKAAGAWRNVNRSPPSSSEVKNGWSCPSTPPICLHDVDRETLLFPFYFVTRRFFSSTCRTPSVKTSIDPMTLRFKQWRADPEIRNDFDPKGEALRNRCSVRQIIWCSASLPATHPTYTALGLRVEYRCTISRPTTRHNFLSPLDKKERQVCGRSMQPVSTNINTG
jgi:hypothetical protein